MKELIADQEGHVEGLAALYPPGTIVYVDEAGHYAGHRTETVEEERDDATAHAPSEPPTTTRGRKASAQLPEEPA